MDQHQMKKEEIERRANVCHITLELLNMPRSDKDVLHHCIEQGAEVAKKVNDFAHGKCESAIEAKLWEKLRVSQYPPNC